MNAASAASSTASNTRSADLVGPEPTVRMVTKIVEIVVGLTFLFGFYALPDTVQCAELKSKNRKEGE
ncbi:MULTISPECIES: hypothetical protein [unclassified Frankia]|uniref:hypothetical protein n=1 Tax=unclassified Frankia TaxID=2632575 RepID=UPI001EF48474|nr:MULTISPECIES: hypothetical protein [unclassified Frankia]